MRIPTYCQQKGFTLVEILVVVIIVGILVTMAMPMYERAIEKSHVAEVSTNLKRLEEAKLRAMDAMDITNFAPGDFTISQLDISALASTEFSYSLYPNETYPNAVCATRLKGTSIGTVFLYLGETAAEYCSDCSNPETDVCTAYCTTGRKLFCIDASDDNATCEVYGMDSYADVGECN